MGGALARSLPDREAASLPPPTQGFAALAILSLLEGFDIGALPEADYVHLVVEATKVAFEDRDRYLTDPTFERVPVEHCLDRLIWPRAAAASLGARRSKRAARRSRATRSPSWRRTRPATRCRSSRVSTGNSVPA
jgi:gamma-glutamyltranspeptidase